MDAVGFPKRIVIPVYDTIVIFFTRKCDRIMTPLSQRRERARVERIVHACRWPTKRQRVAVCLLAKRQPSVPLCLISDSDHLGITAVIRLEFSPTGGTMDWLQPILMPGKEHSSCSAFWKCVFLEVSIKKYENIIDLGVTREIVQKTG